MEDIQVLILALVVLAVGLLIGYLLGRNGSRQNVLNQELTEAHQELSNYKARVNGHFEETAHLMNELTDQYRKVHEHLSQGVQDLCDNSELKHVIDAAMAPKKLEQVTEAEPAAPTDAKQDEATEDTYDAPRDYAPKKSGEEGMLSDGYGVKKPAASAEKEDDNQVPNPDYYKKSEQ